MATCRDVMIPNGKNPWHLFCHSHDAPPIVMASKVNPAEWCRELEAGLMAEPAMISSKFFYDKQGCALYEAICNLEEYYPMRAEAEIFRKYRAEIVALIPPGVQWVDLGCGDGSKSWPWLENGVEAICYVGVDIAESWLREAVQEGMRRCSQMECLGVVADFTRPLHLPTVIAKSSKYPPVFFYSGSSISNFAPAATLHFLRAIRQHLGDDGRLLISVDGSHDPTLLQAAYDDALGVTAAFNRNVLRVANRELHADFLPQRFAHRAFFNPDESRVEMYLEACETHVVHIGNRHRRFHAGETILTEYSHKYSGEAFSALLEVAGFGDIRDWHDDENSFHVFLAAPRTLS